MREAGLTDHVDLSNFDGEQLRTASEFVDIDAHQVEFHPFFRPGSALDHAQRYGYPVEAYSPLAGGRVFEDPTVRDAAERYDTSPAAVAIAWVTGHDNVVTIPKASTRRGWNWSRRLSRLSAVAKSCFRSSAADSESENRQPYLLGLGKRL